MTQAIQRTKEFSQYLHHRLPQLTSWADSPKDAEALVRYTTLAFVTSTQLQRCSPDSIYKACIAAAYTGLKPDGKDAALVAYGGVCQLLPMYQGLIRLALQAGYVASIRSSIAHEKDTFSVAEGTSPRIIHVLSFTDDIGPPIAAYAVAQLSNGATIAEVLRWSEVMKIKKAAKASKGPWIDWTEQMARKSAIKRLCKGLPLSGQFETALRIDNAIETGDQLAYEQAVAPDEAIDVMSGKPSWDADFDPADVSPDEIEQGA